MQQQTSTSTSKRSSLPARSGSAPATDGSAASSVRPKVLGWLSIALGTAAVATPFATARLIGAPTSKNTRLLLRGVGMREIGVGVGLLAGKQSSAKLTWLRVLGDAMDLSLLCAAMGARRAKRERLLGTLGAIAAIGAVDLAAAIMQTREERAQLV